MVSTPITIFNLLTAYFFLQTILSLFFFSFFSISFLFFLSFQMVAVHLLMLRRPQKCFRLWKWDNEITLGGSGSPGGWVVCNFLNSLEFKIKNLQSYLKIFHWLLLQWKQKKTKNGCCFPRNMTCITLPAHWLYMTLSSLALRAGFSNHNQMATPPLLFWGPPS